MVLVGIFRCFVFNNTSNVADIATNYQYSDLLVKNIIAKKWDRVGDMPCNFFRAIFSN